MIKKFFVILLLVFSCVFMGGCKKDKPVLLFNSEQITKKTVYNAQEVFYPGQTVNYVLFMPKGFKRDYLKLQIVKRPDNVPYGGMTIYMGKDVFVDTSKNFYIDKFVIREEGYFVVRFFYESLPNKPIAECNLWVKN